MPTASVPRPGIIMPRNLISLALGFVATLTTFSTARGDEPPEVVEVASSFKSGDTTIAVERFDPAAPLAGAKRPAVVILHGAGGMAIGGPAFREFARALARRGNTALIVHYFDRTGTKPGDLADAVGPGARNPRKILTNFPAWMDTVRDAVAHAGSLPEVNSARVGLLGFSLGSYLALAESSRNPKVAAVVEYFGGLPSVLGTLAVRMPPTLILHGEQDRTVPVTQARDLERLYSARKFPYEIRIYPDQGHGFQGDDGKDAARRALEFFDAHLRVDAKAGESNGRPVAEGAARP